MKESQHYIPEYFLARFAHASERLWRFAHQREPHRASPSRVAREWGFHGPAENGVERSFSKREADESKLLIALDDGKDPNDHALELLRFVRLLTARTRSIRLRLDATYDAWLAGMKRALDHPAVPAALFRQEARNLDNRIEADSQTSPFERLQLRANARRFLACANLVEAQKCILEDLFGVTRNDEAQISALAELLRLPDPITRMTPSRWLLVRSQADSFILGDSCTFVVARENGEILPFLGAGERASAVYAPISHRSVLVGLAEADGHVLDEESINKASASESMEALFAAVNTDRERGYQLLIGKRPTLIPAEQIERGCNQWVEDLVSQNSAQPQNQTPSL